MADAEQIAQQVMLAAFDDELEKIAGLPKRLREHSSARGYDTDSWDGYNRRTSEGKMLQEPDIHKRLSNHYWGRIKAEEIARASKSGGRSGRGVAAMLKTRASGSSVGSSLKKGIMAALTRK